MEPSVGYIIGGETKLTNEIGNTFSSGNSGLQVSEFGKTFEGGQTISHGTIEIM